jgi:hypothetical protein
MSFLVELKRRRVVRVGVVYSATALDRHFTIVYGLLGERDRVLELLESQGDTGLLDRWTWLLGGEPRFEALRRRGQRSEP